MAFRIVLSMGNPWVFRTEDPTHQIGGAELGPGNPRRWHRDRSGTQHPGGVGIVGMCFFCPGGGAILGDFFSGLFLKNIQYSKSLSLVE